jgi:hypothetical protein
LQGFDDCKKFKFDDGVPCLHVGELAAVEGQGTVLLLDDCSNLLCRGIGVNVEWFAEVWLGENDLLGW